jgi:hypothetical protein
MHLQISVKKHNRVNSDCRALRKSKRGMKNPQQAAGYQNSAVRFCLKGVTPECFYRGSSSETAWILA